MYKFIIKLVLFGAIFTHTIESEDFNVGFDKAGKIVLAIHNIHYIDAMVEMQYVEKTPPKIEWLDTK